MTPTPSCKSWVDSANDYARQVVAGKIIACKWVILACRRHLDDLKRQTQSGFAYRFDEKRANRVCKFIEALPHVKGKWAAKGELLKLEPWQRFIVCCLFGWLEKSTGNYRFREAYIKVSRKNAKSTLSAAIGLFKFAADNEHGAEVYSGATSEKQAWEVFRPALQMAERTPALRKAFKITTGARAMAILSTGSRFEPVIGKPGDGPSPSCAIVDEYHEHPDDTLYDTQKTGMGARENPLLLVITTAGSDRSSPCYQLEIDAQKVLEGKVKNERWFVLIFGIDDNDDWTSEAVLQKANPNYDVSVKADYLKELQAAAIQSPRKQNTFKTKHLGVWVNADVSWMNMAAWDALADPTLRIEDFAKEPCVDGLDLATRIDLVSKIRIFRRDGSDPAKPHFYVFGAHYLNRARVDLTENQHYAGWEAEDRLIVTPGDTTDFNWVAEGIIEDSKKFKILEVPHDPWNAGPLVQFIQARDDWDQTVQFVEVRQTVQNLSPAMKELEALVVEKRIHHDGDPVLGWAMSNVVCHTDAKGNIFPRKQREENKIDPAVATIMGVGAWQRLGAVKPAGAPRISVL